PARSARWRRIASSQSVCLLGQIVSKRPRQFGGLPVFQPVLSDKFRQESAVDATGEVMPCSYGQKCPSVVVEADGVVEPRRLGGHAAEAAHPFRTVMKPPGWPQAQARVVARQRGQFAGIGAFIQREEN